MSAPLKSRIRFMRTSAADWTAKNYVLADGEPGFEDDTRKLKVGDGVTAWNDLAYVDTTGFIVLPATAVIPGDIPLTTADNTLVLQER